MTRARCRSCVRASRTSDNHIFPFRRLTNRMSAMPNATNPLSSRCRPLSCAIAVSILISFLNILAGLSSARNLQAVSDPAHLEKPVDHVATVSRTHHTADVISVGSLSRPIYQDVQQRTFGSHEAVRHFFRFSEANDTDRDCTATLTREHMDEIVRFCRMKRTGESRIAFLYRSFQFKPKMHAGWMCAQKRPVEGLFHVLNQYRTGSLDIPPYLIIIDDDTYLNMDLLMNTLLDNFPHDGPHIVAGCNTRMYAFTFPYGGFGTILSRRAIERLIKPIYCTEKPATSMLQSDPFTRLACWRLGLNELGERPFFSPGLSLVDIMFRYASEQPWINVSHWSSGYCVHSDHALGYFLAAYHVSVPESVWRDNKPNDSYRKTYRYTALTNDNHNGRQGECAHERDACMVEHLICHYIDPTMMDALHNEQKLMAKNQSR